MRLIHYDRGGASVTPWFNYHEDPSTFIRLVLGLSSPRESILGLDTSIRWKIDPCTQRKTSGTISTRGAAGERVKYRMQSLTPEFAYHGIRGRGTTCWRVTHPKGGKDVIVKDAWRTGTRVSESVYLTAAKGIKGVSDMISFEDNLATTDTFRPDSYCGSSKYENRIKLRVVMEAHGPSILEFKSRYQLVSALRDAIKGELSPAPKFAAHDTDALFAQLIAAFMIYSFFIATYRRTIYCSGSLTQMKAFEAS